LGRQSLHSKLKYKSPHGDFFIRYLIIKLGSGRNIVRFLLFTGIVIKKIIMSTFETILWWYGVILFSIGTTCGYGLLGYTFFQCLKDIFKK
jgi:hypothetical protein